MVPIQELPHVVAVSISRVFYRWLHNIKRGIELLEILAAAELYKTDLDVDSAIRHIKILLSTTREDIDQTQLIRAVEILGHAETLESFDDKISLLRREIASFNNNAPTEKKSHLEVEDLIGNMDQREDDGIPYHLLALLNTERPIEQDIPFRVPLTGDNYTEIDENGNISLYGDARVEKKIQLPVSAFKTHTGATIVDHGLGSAIEFSKSAFTAASCNFHVPTDFDNTEGLTLSFHWSSPAVTGDVVWVLKYQWRASGENTTSTTPEQTITLTKTTNGTTNCVNIINQSLVYPPGDSDGYGLVRIARNGGSASDDADDVANIVSVSVDYTSNRLGDPI